MARRSRLAGTFTRFAMVSQRFGENFPSLFTAALLQELSFALLIHLPGYLNQLGATEGLIGVLYASSAVVSLVFRPWLGRILDLTRRRTVLLISAVINMAVIIGLTVTTVWGPLLWVLFLVQRTVQIALFTTMLTYGADSIPLARRTQGLAIFGLSGLIPIAAGGYVGDVLIDRLGFDGLFWGAAAVSLVSWLVVWTLPVLPVRGHQPRRSFWAAFAQRNLLPLWLATFLFSVGLESLFTFTRTFVDQRQVGTAGLFFATYGVSAAITRIAGGQMYDRMPHRPMLVGGILSYGVGLICMGLAQTVPILVLAAAITGTAHGAVFPLISSEVVNRARVSERGSAMATFTSIFDIALLAGAPVVGFVIEGFDYLAAFVGVGVVLLVGAIVYRQWDRRIDHSLNVAEEIAD
ncbi:MAG TPA: MFS transporter [Acidimicrobiia bacterium]|nr:MFS transporter [Acidimicrobiia bacterium]